MSSWSRMFSLGLSNIRDNGSKTVFRIDSMRLVVGVGEMCDMGSYFLWQVFSFSLWNLVPQKGAHAQKHIHSSDSPRHCDNVQNLHKICIEVGHTHWHLEHKWELLRTPQILVGSVATRFNDFTPCVFFPNEIMCLQLKIRKSENASNT